MHKTFIRNLLGMLGIWVATSIPAWSGELLVDDFDDGNLESELGLAWMVIADDAVGGGSDGQITTATKGGSRAAIFTASRKVVEPMPIGFVGAWTPVGDDGGPRDLSAYRGVRVRARALAGQFQVSLRRTGINASFAAPLPVSKKWTEVEVPFGSLKAIAPPGVDAPSWSASDATWIGITSAGPGDGDLRIEIDTVAFYGGPTAAKARPSAAATGSPTATVELADPATMASLPWRSLSREAAGDGLRPRLPDALALSWATAKDGWVWFRVSLADTPPERWMGINIALDVDGDPANGMAWWGSNKAFHFDELITAFLNRADRYWMGTIGVATADDIGRGVMDGKSTEVRATIDRAGRAFLVGVPRRVLGASGEVRAIATVGSSMANNDDLPNEGAVTFVLPP